MSARRLSRLLIVGSLAAVLAAVTVVVVLLSPSDDGGGTPSRDSVDAGFARDMAVHHQQAVELSFIVRDRTDDEEVRRLAYDIINTQANQRGMLLGMLDAWDLPKSSQQAPMAWMGGHASHEAYEPHDGSLMPGMATNAEMDRLRQASGRDAEVLYLRLMTEHHKGGVPMSEVAAESAGTEDLRRLAQGMVNGQQAEIALMADMLEKRGRSS
ncbi:DUF305 domain-containing protein [Streptomyces sp. NPDC018693]|uniref:DUF305 domain-containing protein n=1 Tax=unclassified Streptomyces TaxID=2593676 RepID=UPI0037910D69